MKRFIDTPVRTIRFVTLCDDEVGEVQGAFDASDDLLHWWALNDGVWRGEYFDPLLQKLGVEVEYPDDAVLEDKLREAVKSLIG